MTSNTNFTPDFTLEWFDPETGRWTAYRHLGETRDLEWVHDQWRAAQAMDIDHYYRVTSAEGVWLGTSKDNPLLEDRN